MAADLKGQRHLSTSKPVSNHELLSRVTTLVQIKLLKGRNTEAGHSFDSQHVGVHRRGPCNGKYEMRNNEEHREEVRNGHHLHCYEIGQQLSHLPGADMVSRLKRREKGGHAPRISMGN